MKRILVLASLLFLSSLGYAQGFDKDMVKAGKEFHKNQKRTGGPKSKNPKRVSTLKTGRSASKTPKRVSTLDGTRSKKKNRARRKSSTSQG